MPWNLPNVLILVRIALIFPIVYLLFADHIANHAIYSLILFCIAALTDFVDGWMARRYQLITTFGKYADPIADKLLVLVTLFAFAALGEIAALWAWIIMAREVGIMLLRIYAGRQGIVISARWSGKIKTTTQIALVVGLFILLQWDLGLFGTIARGLLIFAAVASTILSGLEYLYKSRSLFKTAT